MTESFQVKGGKTVYYVVKGKNNTTPLKFFTEYDEADLFIKENNNLSHTSDEEKLFLCNSVDEDHYLLIDELINEYLESESIIDQPVVVFYKRSKIYKIVSNEILTNEHWVKYPFTLFGSIFDTNVLIRDPYGSSELS